MGTTEALTNRPYHKEGVTQDQITADRFDCIHQLTPEWSWEPITADRLDACMREKGYTVELQACPPEWVRTGEFWAFELVSPSPPALFRQTFERRVIGGQQRCEEARNEVNQSIARKEKQGGTTACKGPFYFHGDRAGCSTTDPP